MLHVWTKGVESAADKRRVRAEMSCLGKLNGIGSWGTTPGSVAAERAARRWRHGVTGVSPAQLAALDKENEDRLDQRLARSNTAFQKSLAAAKAQRRKLRL